MKGRRKRKKRCFLGGGGGGGFLYNTFILWQRIYVPLNIHYNINMYSGEKQPVYSR